ncbi:MAG TPA: RagB/SusD family nutrient uptake outer membrane protein [Puia sp.]|nr:RagB/SusD family nutrient uptake outer membrane protein [Puia sp.]
MKGGRFILFIFFLSTLLSGCTKLHETEGSYLTSGQVADNNLSATLLQSAYFSLEKPFTTYFEIFALSDLTTDEAIAPTRANNWDDNGQWRVLHQQTWDPNSPVVHNCFQDLGGAIFAATDVLQPKYNATGQQQAEARFIRAWAMYWMLDLFDQVPYRDPGESVISSARVRKGMDALNYIISEINAVEDSLPDGPAGEANKYAAMALLMKCYLNKSVYKNRVTPADPDPADMDSVIKFADAIINSPNFSLAKNYFDNFAPDNVEIGSENIFTQLPSFTFNYGTSFSWQIVLEYAQYPSNVTSYSCFNGWTTLSDFYNRFEPSDIRRGIAYTYPGSFPNPGNRVNVGFLVGQQYDLNVDTPIFDQGNALPLIYTPEVQNIEPGPNVIMTGIRPLKYAPDFSNFNYFPPPGNSFVYLRLSDVLLMKAEAILRGGKGTIAGTYGNNAKDIVNAIRTHSSRQASAMSSVTLDSLYDERGRELWWESWRRQDMVRFGKFLMPFQEKEYTSDPKYLLFPIPYDQLALNTNYQQNPGY